MASPSRRQRPLSCIANGQRPMAAIVISIVGTSELHAYFRRDTRVRLRSRVSPACVDLCMQSPVHARQFLAVELGLILERSRRGSCRDTISDQVFVREPDGEPPVIWLVGILGWSRARREQGNANGRFLSTHAAGVRARTLSRPEVRLWALTNERRFDHSALRSLAAPFSIL